MIALLALALAGCNTPTKKRNLAGDPIQPANFAPLGNVGEDCDTPARLISGDNPIYPVSQVVHRRPGVAQVEFTINPDGRTGNLRVVSATNKYFGNHAIIAIRGWRFSPALKDGQPVSIRVQYSLYFHVE